MWVPGAATPLLATQTVDGARYPHRMEDDRTLALVARTVGAKTNTTRVYLKYFPCF